MIQKFYLHDGQNQSGPFSIEDLKEKNITELTDIWYEGASAWLKAKDVIELKDILIKTPPPFPAKEISSQKAPPLKSIRKEDGYDKFGKVLRGIGIIGALALVAIFTIGYLNSRDTSGAESPIITVIVNPPNPQVLTSRSEEAPESEFLDYAQGVDGTVLNRGGDGNVLITATLSQGGKTYTRSEEAYMKENQSIDVHYYFTEANVLKGEMTYHLRAKALK